MKKRAGIVTVVAVSVAVAPGLLLPASSVTAADRRPADATRLDPNYRPRGSAGSGTSYHADYHADYRGPGGDRSGRRDEDVREPRPDWRLSRDGNPLPRRPFDWRR